MFLSLLVTLAPLFSPVVSGAESSTGTPKNPKKLADGYAGKFDPTGCWVAYLNIHDGLLHVVSTDTGIDVNTGLRPFGHPSALLSCHWEGGTLRVLTSDFRIVRTDTGFKPQSSITLKGAADLLRDKGAEAVLNPKEDCACGVVERIEHGDPSRQFHDLKLYSPDKAPIWLIPEYSFGYKDLLGWDAGGQHLFYSIYKYGTYMVDKEGTNTTLVANWSQPQLDPTSGKMFYPWMPAGQPTGQIAVQDMDNSTEIRLLNYSKLWHWDCLNMGMAYGYDPERGIIKLDLTTLNISLLWPWTTELAVDIRDVSANKALVYCEGHEHQGCETHSFWYGLYLIDMAVSANFSSEEFQPMRDFYWNRAPRIEPDLSHYEFVMALAPLMFMSLALLVLGILWRARPKPGRTDGPTV